jgi:hypothetical protein
MLEIEDNGPVVHLIFAAVQKVGDERRAVVVDRVIVPSGMLAVFARQLARPELATVRPGHDEAGLH